MHPRDLEAIVVSLELAAIDLSPTPESVFSTQQFVDTAIAWAGPECPLDAGDLRIVIPFCKFVKRVRGGYQLR